MIAFLEIAPSPPELPEQAVEAVAALLLAIVMGEADGDQADSDAEGRP